MVDREIIAQNEKKQFTTMDRKIWVKNGTRIIGVDTTNILYVEGNKMECIFHIKNHNEEKRIICSAKISTLEKILEEYGFIRCHRNYIFNPLLAEAYSENKLLVIFKKTTIPCSRRKKIEVIHDLI